MKSHILIALVTLAVTSLSIYALMVYNLRGLRWPF